MADRVRMKSKSSFDNPLIYNHEKDREARTFVQDGDEFSTEPDHAEQLFRSGLADKIDGDVSDITDRQTMIKGAQTPAARTAMTTNRKVETTPAAPTVSATPAAAAPTVKTA